MIKAFKICFKFNCSGLPSFNAKIFELNVDCRGVNLNNLFNIISCSTSLFNSMTILTPFRSDSSLISETPSMILLFTVSAIFSSNLDLFT